MPRRVVVIGAGRIADEHLTALTRHPQVDLAGVCDVDERLAARASTLYGAQSFTDAAVMLAETRPAAVHITTPPGSHVPLARQALAAGAALVVVEKPAALAASEVEELLADAGRRGAHVVEDHNYRFNRPVRRLRELVADGALGEVRTAEIRMAMPLASSRYDVAADRRVAEGLPGGVLHEFLPHLCYLGTWLVPDVTDLRVSWGKRDPTTSVSQDDLEVSGTSPVGRRLRLVFESGVQPATTTVTVRGTRGWAEADLQLSALRTSLPRGAGQQLDPLVDMAVGGAEAWVSTARSFVAKLRGSPIYEGVGVFVEQLYDAWLGDHPLPVDGSDMIRSARLLDAIVERRP